VLPPAAPKAVSKPAPTPEPELKRQRRHRPRLRRRCQRASGSADVGFRKPGVLIKTCAKFPGYIDTWLMDHQVPRAVSWWTTSGISESRGAPTGLRGGAGGADPDVVRP
jgi:hypothetical protein